MPLLMIGNTPLSITLRASMPTEAAAKSSAGSVNEGLAPSVITVLPALSRKLTRPSISPIAAQSPKIAAAADYLRRLEPEEIRATIARIKALGVKRVLVVGQFPIWHAKVPQLRARNYRFAALGLGAQESADIERDKTFLKGSVFATDEMLRQVVAGTGAEFVSPLRTLCNGEGCLLVVPDTNGLPIYWDDNHFTRSGAIYFVDHNAAAFAVP